MNYSGKLFMAVAALALYCPNIWAQKVSPQDSTASAETAFPEDAPMLQIKGAPQRYYIRDIHIRGVKYLNEEVLKSSASLVAGDSIYLPSNFISNAISRLWSQRHFADVKIGAEIEGDSIDLEVFLKSVRGSTTGTSRASPRARRRSFRRSSSCARTASFGLRHRQESETHPEILGRQGLPQRHG